jgi:hypothetical protein
MGLGHSPSIVRDGLVLYLDAANSKSYPGSGTTWFDLSGNENNGTLVNGVGFDNANKGALTFDGTDDFVNCGNSVTLKPEFISIEAWVKINPGQGLSFICGGGTTGAIGYWVGISTSNNTIRFSCRTEGDNNGAQYSVTLSESITQRNLHIVATYSGQAVKIFLNSKEVFSESLTTKINYAGIENDNIHIGDIGSAGSRSDRFFEGNIFNIKIYNRALAESEIKQNFNATRGRYGV